MPRNKGFLMNYTMSVQEEEAEVMVYSEIWDSKFWGDETTPKDFDKALKEARKSGANKLKIRINSPGGEVFSAVAMRAMIMNAGFEEISVRIEGLCASAATLLAAVPGARVTMVKGSEYMVHNPRTWVAGDANAMEKTAADLRKMEGDFHAIYARRTGKSEAEIRAMMDETTWMTAEEAVEKGFADEVEGAEAIAARVSMDMMEEMKGLYGKVPDGITVAEDAARAAASRMDGMRQPEGNAAEDGRAAEKDRITEPTVAAGAVSVINQSNEEDGNMDIKDLKAEEIQAGNPQIYADILKAGAEAERERIQEIDDLTPAGYEAMAAEAKANGTSAMDYHKQIVKAQKEKGQNFLASRQTETAPAAQVTGSAAEDETGKDLAKARDDYADELVSLAKGQTAFASDGEMF